MWGRRAASVDEVEKLFDLFKDPNRFHPEPGPHWSIWVSRFGRRSSRSYVQEHSVLEAPQLQHSGIA